MELIQAIDVHGHVGTYIGGDPHREKFMSGDAKTIVERAEKNHIALTFVSPLSGLLPRGKADAARANAETIEIVHRYPQLRQWVIIDPRSPRTFEQARELLSTRRCIGIKIHPEEHVYPIREYGESLFKLAAEFRAVVLTHSGEINSLPADFVPLADAYPEVTLILAHLGCGHDSDPTHQIRAIAAHKHGNMYVDTSSASNILPGLIEYAVSQIGAERLLFGTDTPLYFLPMQRARIDRAEIPLDDKKKILHQNAEKLFGILL
jgi:predicted TIM-barrel fold metal-dependent hydrolase